VVWLRTVLEEMGYKQQQPTWLICDNACAVGIANESVKIKRSRAISMRYHWIKDRVKDHEIKVSWVKGVDNFADFFTKALPVKEHQIVKHRYVSSVPILRILR
jgi:hypothetical protein